MASIYKRKKGGSYYITYVVRPGQRRTVKGCRDRAATEAYARKLEADAMLRREGVIDVKADQYAKSEARLLVVKDANGKVIDGHLADFHASLHAKSTTEKHADLVQSRIVTILDLCNAKQPSQLVPSAVQAAIASLRDGEDNLSLQTCNHYLRAIKQFSRWLWRDGRLREDPLAHLVGFNVQLDRRHDRRALTDEELARLIEAAEKGPLRLSMSGPERAVLYQLAVGTGFRANELRSLTSESFNLDADPPIVTIEAAYSKHRRRDEQPIRRDLADLLRPWLKGKPAEEPVFRLPDKVFKLMQADLAAARDAWLKDAKTDKERQERERSTFLAYRDGGGRVADFHALRHTYISRLVASGANIKVAQELARHSTPTLTLGRYAHVQLLDRTRALDALPSLDKPGAERQAVRATGTDNVVAGVNAEPQARSARAARRTPGTPRPAITGQDGEAGDEEAEGAQAFVKATTYQDLPLPDNGAPGVTRTPDLRFRKPPLYPAELRAQDPAAAAWTALPDPPARRHPGRKSDYIGTRGHRQGRCGPATGRRPATNLRSRARARHASRALPFVFLATSTVKEPLGMAQPGRVLTAGRRARYVAQEGTPRDVDHTATKDIGGQRVRRGRVPSHPNARDHPRLYDRLPPTWSSPICADPIFIITRPRPSRGLGKTLISGFEKPESVGRPAAARRPAGGGLCSGPRG